MGSNQNIKIKTHGAEAGKLKFVWCVRINQKRQLILLLLIEKVFAEQHIFETAAYNAKLKGVKGKLYTNFKRADRKHLEG